MPESAIEQIGAADLVIGLVAAPLDAPAIESAIARIVESTPPLRTVLVHPPYTPNGTKPPPVGTQWQLLGSPQLLQDPSSLAQSMGDGFRTIFEVTKKLGARACAVVGSDLSTVTADWVGR